MAARRTRPAGSRARKAVLAFLRTASFPPTVGLLVRSLSARRIPEQEVVEAARILLRDQEVFPVGPEWRLWLSRRRLPAAHARADGHPCAPPPAGLATCVSCRLEPATRHVGSWNGERTLRGKDGVLRPASCDACIAPLPEDEVRRLLHAGDPADPQPTVTRLAAEVLELRELVRSMASTVEQRMKRVREVMGSRMEWTT